MTAELSHCGVGGGGGGGCGGRGGVLPSGEGRERGHRPTWQPPGAQELWCGARGPGRGAQQPAASQAPPQALVSSAPNGVMAAPLRLPGGPGAQCSGLSQGLGFCCHYEREAFRGPPEQGSGGAPWAVSGLSAALGYFLADSPTILRPRAPVSLGVRGPVGWALGQPGPHDLVPAEVGRGSGSWLQSDQQSDLV